VVEAAGETTWERILRVSADLFAQKGYHGTGLSELTDAIHLGRGGLYHHIRSKDSLLAQISRKPIREAADQAEAIVAQDITAEEKVVALARGLVSSIEAQPSPWIVFFREYSSLPPEYQREVLEQRERYLYSWEQAVEQGVRAGDFCDDRPLFLEGLLAFFIYSYIWVNNKGTHEPLGDSLARFVLRGLRKSL
jgi:Transcriptional regulator